QRVRGRAIERRSAAYVEAGLRPSGQPRTGRIRSKARQGRTRSGRTAQGQDACGHRLAGDRPLSRGREKLRAIAPPLTGVRAVYIAFDGFVPRFFYSRTFHSLPPPQTGRFV